MAIWDDILNEADKKMFAKAKMGGSGNRLGKKPALVIVDMTVGFTDSRYRLGNSDAFPSVEATAQLLQKARGKKLPIFYTIPYAETHPAGIGVWKGGEPKSEEEIQIVDIVAPLDNEIVLQKRKPSAFFGTDLVNLLIYNQVDSLIVTGLTTSGCVRATVVDGFSYNYNIVVPEECAGDRSEISHKASLMDMHMKYADVVKLNELMQWMDDNL